ncbi:MAG: uroporphyrinogen decarboxylase family protein [Planctomycetia bacterium]|jgi:uroporphyrinogen decarboxylase
MQTAREKVQLSLAHSDTFSRVAKDLGGHRSSGISAIAYARLKEHLGIASGDIYVYDMIQQLAIVEPEILDRFNIDCIEMGRGFCLDASDWQPWVLPDGTLCKIPAFLNVEKDGNDWYLLHDDGTRLAVQREGCLYFEQCYYPWEGRSVEEVDLSELEEVIGRNMWVSCPSPGGHLSMTRDGLTQLAEGARKLRESTDRAIVGLFGGNMFELPQWLFRMDHWLFELALHPEGAMRLHERLCEIYLKSMKPWLKAVGPYIDIILFGDDLGSQNGPMISPQMYRDMIKPFHTKLWNRAKELADVQVQLHCCGGVEPLLNDLIEAGLDIINPVQITCNGMEPAHLKETFGDRLTFWGGGCDTRSMLTNGAPAEIKRHVKELLKIWTPSGGFVFEQVHNIQANVPPENVVAMFDAIAEFDAENERASVDRTSATVVKGLKGPKISRGGAEARSI